MLCLSRPLLSCSRINYIYLSTFSPLIASCSFRSVHLSISNFKGHSKWQNIKVTKMSNDAIRSKVINRMCNQICKAIKIGGSPDPKINSGLAKLLLEAAAHNVPKDTIQRQLERAKSKPVDSHIFDVLGPAGTFYIVELMTDNLNRSRNELNKIFKKIGFFRFADSGIRNFFEEKGVLVVALRKKPESGETETEPIELSLEDAETIAIEIHAEEVVETVDENDKPALQFICDPKDRKSVEQELTSRGFWITSSDIEYRSITKQSVNEEDATRITQFFENVNNHVDVNRVFDNVDLD